ncbi:hypothetical protein Tco_0280263 [Tanacetum coccineum]
MEECHKLLTNQVDDRRLSKGDRIALSITKMKAAYYPDVGLEQMVPDQMWIEAECMNLVIQQRVDDFQLGIESYQTQLNLTKPRWEATGLEFMHDYKILDSLRSVLFRDKYGMQMLISGESSRTWKALLVEEYAKETTDFYGEPNDDILSVASRTSCVDGKVRYSIPRSRQSRRDLPRDNPLVSVEVLSEDGNPARANIKQALGLHKDGDADASFHFRNSDKYYHDPEECEYAGPKVTTSHEGNIPQQG